MRERMYRTLGILLGLLLCVELLPTSVLAATDEVRYQQTHGGEWITGSFSEACGRVYEGGVIELLKDIELTTTQTISKSVTITSSDKNNPHSILATSPSHAYLLNLEGAVILKHVILDGGSQNGISASRALVSVNAQGNTVTIADGTVIQNNSNMTEKGAGGGLCLISGNVEMNGGMIRNCSAQTGGAVAIVNGAENKFILNSGSITGNHAWGDSYSYGGGGIYIAIGTFEMNNGTISENRGYAGGAVFINNANSAYVKITGGNITNNEAQYGGGIYSSQIKVMELYGGNITNNIARIRGGGVFISPLALVKLKGPVVVANNLSKGDNAFYNFYIEGNPNNSSFKADVQLVGSLESAQIGVSTMFDPAQEPDGKLFVISTDGTYLITESDFEAFDSDDDAYHILRSENRLYLQPHRYTAWQTNQDGHWKTCECGMKTTLEAHQWDEGTILKESSCDETGLIEYKCNICGYQYQLELASKPHVTQYYQEVSSMCTEDGNIEHWYCEVCDSYFSDVALTAEITKEETIIEATGHQIILQNAKEPTCTEEGYTGDKVCAVCGELIEKGVVIPKIPHNFVNGQCTVCGYEDAPDSSNPTDTTCPKTGDSSNTVLWTALLLASGAGIIAMAMINKKRHHAK